MNEIEKLEESEKLKQDKLEEKRFSKKTVKSKKKLENFFGQAIPVDVSIRDVEQLGIKAILASRVPLCYFLYQLLEDHCSENLFFYLEVDLYEHTKFQSHKMMIDIGVELYDTFLRADSEFEVNIPQKIRAPILDQIKSGKHYAFSPAKEHILKLMEPVFLKFRNGPIFDQMRRELGYTSVYNKKARNYAVRILLQNLDKNLAPIEGASTSLAKERNDMLRAMLHAFCEMKLGIDFTDGDVAEGNTEIEKKSKKGQTGTTAETDDILGSVEFDDSFTNYLTTL